MFESIEGREWPAALDDSLPPLDEWAVDADLPADLGDWEPIPAEVWAEVEAALPEWPDSGLAFADEPVDEALRLPLGPHTLRLLTMTPVAEMSGEAKAWALRRTRELINHLEGFCAELTASIAGPKPQDPRADWGAYEVAVASKCSAYAADRQVAFARALAGRLSATGEALHAGRISERQARELSEQTAHLPDGLAAQVEARMLKYSHRQDFPKFKASLRRWMARLDPDFALRALRARRDITVEHVANDDGTDDLHFHGPLEQTSLVHSALGAYAAATKQPAGGTADARQSVAGRQ